MRPNHVSISTNQLSLFFWGIVSERWVISLIFGSFLYFGKLCISPVHHTIQWLTGWKKMGDSPRTRFHYVAAPFFIVMIIWWAASAVLCCHSSQLGFHKKALRENQSLYWEHYDEIPKRTLHNSILIIVTAVRRGAVVVKCHSHDAAWAGLRQNYKGT